MPTNPPPPGRRPKETPLPKAPCDHSFTFLRSVEEKHLGPGLTTWVKTDHFFCSKCLDVRTKALREDARHAPAWWNQ